MISDHEFSLGRNCPVRIHHARAGLPREDQGGGMAAWMRAESGKVRALAGHLFPEAVHHGATEPVGADLQTRQLIDAGTAVRRARLFSGSLRCEVDFIVPEPKTKTLRVYQTVARPVDLEQHRRGLVLTDEKGKIDAKWRQPLELMEFRLEVIRSIWPQHRVWSFFIVPAKGRESGVEGLHGFFEETAEGWVCTHANAGVEAERLLTTIGATKECGALAADVRRRTADLIGWLERPQAPILGYSCKKCPFKVEGRASGFEQCWGRLAQVTPHMFDLAYMYFVSEGKKPVADRLAREGRVSLWDIPTELIDGEHADRQFMQLEGMRTGQVILDEELQDEMSRVTYPLHFLDIETTQPVLPPHGGSGSGVGALHIFQLSLHRRTHPGAALEHLDWLNTERRAPNRDFLAALRARVGDHGTVLVYSTHERRSFNTLLADLIDQGDDSDDLRWLRRFLDGPRLVDMHAMTFRHVWYPGMAGKTSLKWLLPAVWKHATAVKRQEPYSQFPEEMDPYAVLKSAGQVSEGCAAMVAYLELQSSEGEKRETKIRELREYCGTDTMAMALCWSAWEHELAQRRNSRLDAVPEQPRSPPEIDPAASKETALVPIACGEGADA